MLGIEFATPTECSSKIMSHLWCSHENQYCNAQAANNVASTTKQVNERDKAFTFILARIVQSHAMLPTVFPF
jgi:hypothetical protein